MLVLQADDRKTRAAQTARKKENARAAKAARAWQ
jgi:hypothetical protein